MSQSRPLAIITGANGGMGRACARLFGAHNDLLLTDADPGVQAFANELTAEGFTVAGTVSGSLDDDALLEELVEITRTFGSFGTLIHTCGLGPSAPWRAIMQVNYVATVKLLERFRPLSTTGSVAILIASVAAHMMPDNAAIDTILSEPLAADFHTRLEPILMEQARLMGNADPGFVSYALSKQQVLALCQAGARDWAMSGARIVSISPGMIYTNMGRHEAEVDPQARQAVESSPLARWGTAMEIAHAALFLASPAAAFITGSDLKVDGGAVGSLRANKRILGLTTPKTPDQSDKTV